MIALRKPAVDWITLTTFNHDVGKQWRLDLLKEKDFIRLDEKEKASHMQYKGMRIPADGGTIFWGHAEQGRGKRNHWLVMFSGRLADEVVFGELRHFLRDDKRDAINCTRIDYQVTEFDGSVLNKEHGSIGYLQKMFSAIQEVDRVAPSWIQDSAKKTAIATIGMGKRVGQTYRRLYAKPTSKGHALRWEMEYKGDKAKGALKAVLYDGGRKKMGEILRWELDRMGISELVRFFQSALPEDGYRFPVNAHSGQGNTEMWLMRIVLPSFERFLATSERGDYVGAAFGEAYSRAMTAWDESGRWRDSDIMVTGEGQFSDE